MEQHTEQYFGACTTEWLIFKYNLLCGWITVDGISANVTATADVYVHNQ